MIPWSILLKYKSYIGLGVLALVVGLYVTVLKVQIGSLQADKVALEKEVAERKADVLMAEAKVSRLENAMAILTEDGKRRQSNAAMWRKKYEDSARRWQEVVSGLGVWTPMPNEPECESAKRLLKEYRK